MSEEEIKDFVLENFHKNHRLKHGDWEESHEEYRKRRIVSRYALKFHLKGKRKK